MLGVAGTMREEDGGARYMSPLVKQDLAKLEKDGESRRVALHALKQFVENLEPSSVPRFLAQVSIVLCNANAPDHRHMSLLSLRIVGF